LIHNAVPRRSWDTDWQLLYRKSKNYGKRAQRYAEFVEGKCVPAYGIFQDIDKEKKAV